MPSLRALQRLSAAVAVAGGAWVLWQALDQLGPPAAVGQSAPISARLFIVHVPIAFTAFVAFGVAFYHALVQLARPAPQRDLSAAAATEVGLFFAVLTLVTGMLWGKAEWGVWWRFTDVKLDLVLLMTVIYAGALLLRREVSDPDRRARVCAVYTCAAFVTVPLAWFAQRLWNSVHPVVFAGQPGESGVVTSGYLPAFFVGLATFVAMFLFFFLWRRDLMGLQQRAVALEAKVTP